MNMLLLVFCVLTKTYNRFLRIWSIKVQIYLVEFLVNLPTSYLPIDIMDSFFFFLHI